MQLNPSSLIPLQEGEFVRGVVVGQYDPIQINCIESTLRKLLLSDGHPVMLLGKVQSGKTRTFLGVISYAFDNGFDISVILTKGTRALAHQTLKRLQSTFRNLDEDDAIRIYDIMHLPQTLPKRDRRAKILLVVKKEDDNLARLAKFLFEDYPELGNKRILLIDDEADMASVGFRGTARTGITQATIPALIEDIRRNLTNSAFLQVTATPYALYLQPEAERDADDQFLFQPMRPAFTEIVPIHDKYVGGDDYFVRAREQGTVESFLHCEVLDREFDAMKKSDGRRLKLEDVLTSPNCSALRVALLDFIVGAAVRRLQQKSSGERRRRYSMIVHTEQARQAHAWQKDVATTIVERFADLSENENPEWARLVEGAYDRIAEAVRAVDGLVPALDDVKVEVSDLVDGVRVQRVNSDEDVFAMLDDNGQLRLESVLTVFIGGQILDRGITIDGLIAFYYGRNPQAFQQDTVLQHSRMYGARPKDDLPVTRFYTSTRLHEVMTTIHDFDHALRVALERDGDQGVAFIRQEAGRIRPCAPSKVKLSKLTSLTPKRRLLPSGFDTIAPSSIRARIQKIDRLVDELGLGDRSVLLDVSQARALASDCLDLLNLEVPGSTFNDSAFLAAISYLSQECREPMLRGKVLVAIKKNRKAQRTFQVSGGGGRANNIPYSGQEALDMDAEAINVPYLLLLRQEGSEDEGWRGAPFWWPVLQVPEQSQPVVFSAEVTYD